MAGDSPAGDAAFLNGEEIVNAARTVAYLKNGYGPPNLDVNGGCICPNLRELIGCDTEDYATPAGDPAPWFDSSIPESADFAGFLPVEFEGLSATYSRENVQRITGGSVLGRQRYNERILTWRGFLFGRTCCATQFGLRWLTAQLSGIPCGCDNEDLDLLICCPESVTGITNCQGLPSVQFSAPCTGFAEGQNYDSFRTLKEVGLFEGPEVVSERRISCRGDCDSSGCAAESCIIEVEFSLAAGNPFLHGCPILACEIEWPPAPTGCTVDWVKILPGEECPPEETCPEPLDCTLDEVACPPAPVPSIPEINDECFCDPFDPITVCCEVTDDMFGEFFEGVPIISLSSGSAPMRAVSIKFIHNPASLDCSNVDVACGECAELQIRFIPANSTLVIDGTTQRISIICPGNNVQTAENLVTSPFLFPTLKCVDYCICFTAESLGLAEDALIGLIITPRQM